MEGESDKKESDKKQEVFNRLTTTVMSLESDYDPVWGSQVKQTVKRVYPGFNETYYGYRSFSDLLEDAAKEGLITIDRDNPSGNHTPACAAFRSSSHRFRISFRCARIDSITRSGSTVMRSFPPFPCRTVTVRRSRSRS